MIFCNAQLLQRVPGEFLKRETSATSNKRILQRVTSDFLQRATSVTNIERISQRVTSDFLQQATSATSNERILQQVKSDFTPNNEQRVNSCPHFHAGKCYFEDHMVDQYISHN